MNIKHFLALVLLFVAVTRATKPSTETTRCECSIPPRPTRTTTPKTTTKPPPSWKPGVDEHITNCRASMKFYFGKTYKIGKTLLAAYECLISKLVQWSTSQSLIISGYSNEILETISTMTEVGSSPSRILNGLADTLPTIRNNYVNMILRLGGTIGVSTSDVADAVTDLEAALSQIIADWKNAAALHIGGDNIDNEPVLKGIQKLTNAVACVSEAALKNCENDANVRDSVLILTLLFDDMVIIALAVDNSITAFFLNWCGDIADPWSQCLTVIDNLTTGLTKALNAVVNTAFEAVISIVKAIVDLAKSLNEALKNVFGLVENVDETVAITLTAVTGSLSNIFNIGK